MEDVALRIENQALLDCLKTVIDPELGIDVVHLGLIYGIEIVGRRVFVRMTLTTPGCPMAGYLTREVGNRIGECFPDVEKVHVELVWEPRWGPDMIPRDVRDVLGWP